MADFAATRPVLGTTLPHRARSAALTVASAAFLAGALLSPPLAAQPTATGGGFAALVNGEPITYYELDRAVERRLLALRARFPAELLADQDQQVRAEVLRELITERLLLQRCEREKVEVRPEEVDHWMQQKIEELRAQDDSIRTVGDFFDRWEADFGENEEQARIQIRNNIRIQKLLGSKIYRQEYISPAELRAHYLRHPEQFTTESKYVFRQIVVEMGDPDLKELLAAIERDIAAQRDFGAMVAEYSRGPRAAEGGRWELTEEQLSSWYAPIPETVRGLAAGEVSEPLRAASRIHVIQLLERHEGRRLAFEECQLEIRARLRKERQELQRERFEEELRLTADVRTF